MDNNTNTRGLARWQALFRAAAKALFDMARLVLCVLAFAFALWWMAFQPL